MLHVQAKKTVEQQKQHMQKRQTQPRSARTIIGAWTDNGFSIFRFFSFNVPVFGLFFFLSMFSVLSEFSIFFSFLIVFIAVHLFLMPSMFTERKKKFPVHFRSLEVLFLVSLVSLLDSCLPF